MIEVIYKDEKQEVNDGETGWNLPKNIRQIGLAGENYRIYIEDYVYTFLHRAAQAKCQQEEDSGILAVFLGENPVAVRNGVYVYQGSTSGRCRGDHRRTYRDHAEYVAEDPRRTGEIF